MPVDPQLVDDSGRALVPGDDNRVLLIGAGGMLGRALVGHLQAHGINWVGAPRGLIDLSRPDLVRRYAGTMELGPSTLVINCAAWTDVDGAEKDEPAARLVNAEGVAALGDMCRAHGAVLAHFSTDYVFDGQGSRPWHVDDPIAPINAYGRTKAAGERAIAESGCEHLIIRTSWLHGAWGKNFVRTIAGLCLSRPQIRVVSDQVGRPTCVWHLASATLGLLLAGARGVVHVTDGGEPTSWHGFAVEIAGHVRRRWGRASEVLPCTTAEFPRPAKRPAYSVLDVSATESLIGPRPDWRVGLADVMATVPRPA